MTDKKVLHNIIKSYGELPDNWNEHGAFHFSPKLIGRCHYIIDRLMYTPFLSPTGCGSIQFEFEANGSYIEFEVYDDKIKFYSTILVQLRRGRQPVYMENYDELPFDCSVEEINKRVQKIYE